MANTIYPPLVGLHYTHTYSFTSISLCRCVCAPVWVKLVVFVKFSLSRVHPPFVSGQRDLKDQNHQNPNCQTEQSSFFCRCCCCCTGPASGCTLRGVCEWCEERKWERLYFHRIYYRWGLTASRCGNRGVPPSPSQGRTDYCIWPNVYRTEYWSDIFPW